MKGPNPIQHFWIVGLLSILAIVFFIASPLPAHAISCGDTITTDTQLKKNLTHCTLNGIIIGNDNITLDCKGHTISGSGGVIGPSFTIGISLDNRQRVVIQNCKVINFQVGFFLKFAIDNILVSNTANLNDTGFDLESSSQNFLQKNSANNGLQGFILNSIDDITPSDSNVLQGNNASNNEIGLDLSPLSSNNTIVGNTFSNNSVHGILLAGQSSQGFPTEGNVLNSNFVSNNGSAGFTINGASNNTCIGNKVSNNTTGFDLLSEASNNTFIKNKTFSNGTDFTQDSTSTNNVCIHNNFSCN